MKESLITKLPTNELMNTSQKKKRKHRQVLDKLVLFLKCNQIRCFLYRSIPGDPHLAPICTHVPLSHRAAGAAGWVLAPGPFSPVLLPWLGGSAALGSALEERASTVPGHSAALLQEGWYRCPNSSLGLSSLTYNLLLVC